MSTTIAHFSILGEHVTNLARDLVLDGDWRKAYNMLVEDFEGMTSDIAIDILSGKSKLIGKNNDIELVDDTDDNQTYHDTLNYMFGSIFKQDSKYYQPDRIITTFGYHDAIYAYEHQTTSNSIINQCLYYTNDAEIVNYVELSDMKQEYIISKMVNDFPIFIQPCKTVKEAVQNCFKFNKTLSEDGHSIRHPQQSKTLSENGPAIQHPQQSDNIESYRKRIIKQVEQNGNLWVDIFDKQKQKIHKIPAIPFWKWAIGLHQHSTDEQKKEFNKFKWQIVCPSGFKQYADNRYHSDWVIGSGLNPDDIYTTQKHINYAAYDLAFTLLEPDSKLTAMPLVSNGTVTGNIVILENHQQVVEPGSIIVIPHAEPEYSVAANTVHSVANAGAIITETGGKLCHLATIGREKKYRMVMLPNASIYFTDGMEVKINSDTGEIVLLADPKNINL